MKIMIIGRPGSGKSTFALKLSQKLTLPLYHLDKYFFESHWREKDYQAFINEQKSIVAHPAWIIDGNNTKSFEIRYSQTNICYYLKFPRSICYWRVFKRLWHKDPLIDDRAPFCHETVRWSLLKYMWGFEQRIEKQLVTLKKKYPTVKLIELTHDNDVLQAYNNA